jgi:hypothetical protein
VSYYCDASGRFCPVDALGRLRCDCVIDEERCHYCDAALDECTCEESAIARAEERETCPGYEEE